MIITVEELLKDLSPTERRAMLVVLATVDTDEPEATSQIWDRLETVEE